MIPAFLQLHLNKFIVEDRAPAFLLVDAAGALLASGGQLNHYGLEQLQVGDDLNIALYQLAGHLPLQGDEPVLKCVQTESGTFADWHFIKAPEGDYILFLDATELETLQRSMQQKGNELSLSYQQLQKEMRKLTEK